ncbi:hypothetical protein [Novosphingobium sp. 9]|uniref:hypothetical protein n=1 Tax=Novosphingobium sp. 9 TaxID=2025349 RepID=UPI0021B5F2E7|nr:hypothetical protein [Novosphingobium sp. 9]
MRVNYGYENARACMALVACAVLAAEPAPAAAQASRDLLTTAAFGTNDKVRALQLIAQATANADRALAVHPTDRESALQRAVAIGYRGKLLRSRSEVMASLAAFKALLVQDPRNPDVLMAIAAWHLGAVDQLGGLLARAALGARRDEGLAAMARAVELGGNEAFYPGIAALLQIRSDPKAVAKARRLAEVAATAQVSDPLDSVMKRAALTILPSLRAGDGKAAAALALKLLPFGRLET